MKKSVLALSVAAALAAPLAAQADTILYGSARVSVDYNDEDVPFYLFNPAGTSIIGLGTKSSPAWDMVNNDSRLGVIGSEDLGGGLSAVYQYEFGVDVTEGSNFESNRPKYVGLKGGFGTLTLGTQETPYYHVAGVTDIFNSGKTFTGPVWLGGSFNGFKVDFSGNTSRGTGNLVRYDNSVYYVSPEFSGFSAEAMLVMNGVNSLNSPLGVNTPVYSDGVDVWNIAAKYSNGPFFAGVSYIKLDGESNTFPIKLNNGLVQTMDFNLDQWTVGLGYNSGPFSVGFTYEQGTLNEFGFLSNLRYDGVRIGGDDATNYYLTGSYTFGNNVVSAAFGQLDPGTQGLDKVDNYVVGYQYNLSKRTRLWAEYIGRSSDPKLNVLRPVAGGSGLVYNNPYGDQNAVSIGTRVDF
ncbi:MAG: porin [Candidatus Competibacteraceae bacterium]